MAELNYTSEICQKLSALLKANRFPHAILIECADEEAGASAARFASKMLVCENKDMAPCGVCSACKKAQAGSHPDIAEYSGGNAPRSFKSSFTSAIKTYFSSLHFKHFIKSI